MPEAKLAPPQRLRVWTACHRVAGGVGTGELLFVGLGLHDDMDVSIAGLEAARRADRVFAEFYTSRLAGGSLERLEARMGRPVEVMDREAVEQRPEALLKAATTGTVALLVAGDPMAATTHLDLRLRAEERGVSTRVVHGASILTAALTELGLSAYKSGRVVTLPWPEGSYFPPSPYEHLRANLTSGLHTLVLLDIRSEEGRYMTAGEGCGLLMRYEEEQGAGVTGPDALACVVARAGASDCLRKAGRLSELVDGDYGPPLHCIVVPGPLHFMEARALVVLAGADPVLVGDEA